MRVVFTDLYQISVLHLDPNEADSRLIQGMLESDIDNIKFFHVKTKAAFLEALEKKNYNLVLCETNVPGFEQNEPLQLIREKNKDVPFIYITDSDKEIDVLELLNAGATDYLFKEHLNTITFVAQRAIKEFEEKIDRKRAESKLIEVFEQIKKQECKYVSLFNESQDLVCLMDDRKFVEANNRAESILGYDYSGLLNKTFLDFSPQYQFEGDLSSEKLDQLYLDLANRGNVIFEWTFINSKNELVDTEISLSYIIAEERQFVQAIIRDLSEEKKLRRELLHSHQLFEEVQKMASIGIWTFDLAGNVARLSRETAHILGMDDARDMTMAQILAIIVEDYRELFQNALHDAIHKFKKWNIDLLIKTKSGEQIWIKQVGYPVFEGDVVKDIRGMIMDITSTKKQSFEIEQKHKEALKYQSMLLSTQLNPHFIFNALNSIQYYILDQKVETAIKFVSEFSTLMRGVLANSMHNFIPLRTEIEWLKHYLNLERARFSDGFTYEIKTSDDLIIDEYLIPTMLLQPFVENAIIHGVAPLKGGGILEIRFKRKPGKIICEIEDNGVGRWKSRQIKKIQKEIERHKSYGVGITQSKIELLNAIHEGTFTSLVIDKKDDQGKSLGTTVIVEYPDSLSR